MSGLQIERLSAGYRQHPVLRELTLPSLPAGSVTALLGPNAVGKSTLLRAIAGLVRATGAIRLYGCELLGQSANVRARDVTYMPQSFPRHVELRVIESLIVAMRLKEQGVRSRQQQMAQAMEILQRLQIEHLALRFLDELSGGQRQLVSLAQSVALQPKVLLLDEPTSALDLKHQLRATEFIRELTRERQLITVMVLHDLNLAARCSDYVALLGPQGLLSFGTPTDAINPAVLAQAYGIEARVERCSLGMPQVIPDRALA